MKPSPELITNGGFDADTNWIKGTNWTISDGVATFSGSNYAELRQTGVSLQNPMPAGKMYKVTFTISNHVVGGVRVLLGFTSYGTTRSANSTYTEFIRSGTVSNDFRFILATGEGDFSIDNISVKEVGTIAKPSTELITNGGFDTDSDWTKGGGWSIAGGVASANDTINRDLKQDIGAIPGNTYRVTYTILNYVKGNIAVNIAGNSGGQTPANGTYVKDIVAGSAPTALGVLIIRGGGDHQFDVDNVSVKEVKALIK